MKFSEKHPLLFVFWQICLLRQGPEVLPRSKFLLYILLPFYLLSGVVTSMIENDFMDSVFRSAADMVISLALAYLFAHLAGRQQRIVQMLTALIGTGLILGIISIPFLIVAQSEIFSGVVLMVVLYALFLWDILIMGNIFSRTFSMSLPAGLLIAMSYMLLAMLMFYSVFPENG